MENLGNRRTEKLIEDGDAAGVTSPVYALPIDKLFQVALGGGTATVVIEGSADPLAAEDPANADWEEIASLSSDGYTTSQEPWPFVRARISSYSSGTIQVRLGL